MAGDTPPDLPAVAAATEDAPKQAIVPSVKRPADEAETEEMAQVQNGEGSPPRKKARMESVAGADSQEDASDSADEGEVDSEGVSKETTLSQRAGQDTSPEPTKTNAAPSGLRTSFATSVSKQLNPDMAMHTPIPPEDRVQLIDGFRDGETKEALPIDASGVSWTNPPIRADAIVGSSWLSAVSSALNTWCSDFIAANRQIIDKNGVKPDLLKEAFMLRIDKAVVSIPQVFRTIADRHLKNPRITMKKYKSYFKTAKKREKREARKAKKKQQQKESQQKLQLQQGPSYAPVSGLSSTKSLAAQDSSPTDVTTDDDLEEGEQIESDVEMENGTSVHSQAPLHGELDLRHRYYPNIPSDVSFCIACTLPGHNATSCPEAKCKFCQEQHFTYQCPSRQRCGKCKQLGHIKTSCKEKLAVAPGEGFMECAFCEAQDHEEENCTELWQTYRPKIGFTKKVKQLPIFCYCCGAQGHFGSDCGLADPKVPPSEVWTTTYASMYLDSESSELPIVDKNPPPPPPEDSKPIIPGRSIKPQSHIIFEESDDEGENFLRAPAAPAASGAGKSAKSIQIKSNITFGGGSAASASLPPHPLPPHPDQQPPKRGSRRAAAQKALAVINAPPPPPRQGTRRYPLRSDQQASGGPANNSRGQQQQQPPPPLPPGPPSSNARGGRGRGGFSNLGRRGRSNRGSNSR